MNRPPRRSTSAELVSLHAESPFSTSSLPPDEISKQSRTFLLMFGAAVDATTDDEEQWAYQVMKSAYCKLMNNPPLDPARNLPRGLWEAMEWAAKISVETSFLHG